jgi:RNA polymerase sigma-70 factor (ECF subfamily)
MPDPDTGLSLTRVQLRAARAGDRGALDELLARYLPWVRQTVALRLGQPLRACADLDDLVQESLLDAFRGLDRFEDRSEGSFRNWLASIVLNNVRDASRRARGGAGRPRVQPLADSSTSTFAGPTPAARDAAPSELARANELEDRIEQAMLRLSATHREVLILRDRCDLGYAEIAEQLQFKNADTARALYSRALAHLQSRLADDAPGVAERPPRAR